MPDPTVVSTIDDAYLTRAIAVAAESRTGGNHPFGALFVTSTGTIVESQNSVVTTGDPTGHAETNLVRLVSSKLTKEELRTGTLYTSTEPCAMCAGAIYWAGIGRVVYALPEQMLIAPVPSQEGEPTLDLPCREVFSRGGKTVTVAGPSQIEAAAAVHAGFWEAHA